MKIFRKSSGVLIIILAALSFFALPYQDIAYGADGYRFDDLAGPSGKSYQWMVVNGLGSGANTFGANHDVSMQVSADLLESNQEEGIYILNGTPDDSIVENRELSTLFLVVADGTGEFKFQFRSPTDINQTMAEAVGGDINLGSDTGAANARYHTEKEAYSAHLDSTGHYWLDYTFNIETQQGGHSTYDTVKQYFNFIQDASDTSSQTKHMPVVIANVNMESAIEEALELRMTLRDSNTNGNIVAYKHDTWNANAPKDTESRQWVFVPVDDINDRHKNYYLTTDVTNHTSLRYGAQDSTNSWIFPTRWKFDLPRYVGTTNVPRSFYLDPMSHAAPGLVSVYTRRYDMGEENKRPLGIGAFDVDGPREGIWSVVFNNNVLFCKELGHFDYGTDSTFRQVDITAFQTNPSSQTFYEDVAEKTGSDREIELFSSFSTSSITRESPTNEALEYFTINHAIPGSLRSDTVEGMLPLHITFNIPVTRIKDSQWWNNMLDEWRSSGEIGETFAQNLAIYAMADDKNIWNLSQEMNEKGVYDSQIKIFLDEERGRATADNDRGVITVSFMVLLMNGTRDGERPEMSVVTDESNTGNSQSYIAIRDGSDDERLKLVFFIAPANYQTNTKEIIDYGDDQELDDNDKEQGTGSSGGGGCNSGAGPLFVIVSVIAMLALVIRQYKHERSI